MATLMTFIKPNDFDFPEEYKLIENEGTKSFVKNMDTDVEGYSKYIVGRNFIKKIKIFIPKQTDIEEIEIEKQKTLFCFVYIPIDVSDNKIFLVGSSAEALLPDIISFANVNKMKTETIDMRKLEEVSFTSGRIGLMGHRYSTSNNTINYNVRKIDGNPFRKQDPEFVTYDESVKEVLEVRLDIGEENKPCFHVYNNGKITRRGVIDSTTPEFDLLLTVYNIIKEIISE